MIKRMFYKKNSNEISLRKVALDVLFGLIFMNLVAQGIIIQGDSMNPTLYDGQILIMERISPRIRNINRGDIIVFKIANGKSFIKRVVALPNEDFEIRNGDIYINGEVIKDIDLEEKMHTEDVKIHLTEEEYYVLGDNRNESADSRVLGPVQVGDIEGKVLRIFPFLMY